MDVSIVVPVAISGATSTFITLLVTKGADWLIQLVASHSPEVQKKAVANLQNYVNRLANRVERLEAELPAGQRNVFDEALDHPSTSLLLKKAMVSAASTDNEDHHTILSELITQRLTARADDMIALAGSAACDIVNALSSKHIWELGLIIRFDDVRPDSPVEFTDQDAYDNYVIEWFQPLDELSKKIDNLTNIDQMHLLGLGCVVMTSLPKDLKKYLTIPVEPASMEPTMSKFEALPWWEHFLSIFNKNMKFLRLTSIGSLIGILCHDSTLGVTTNIKWSE